MSWLMLSIPVSKLFLHKDHKKFNEMLVMLHADLSGRGIKSYDGITTIDWTKTISGVLCARDILV